MNQHELAEIIADQLIAGNLKISRETFRGNSKYGIHTKSMLCVDLSVNLNITAGYNEKIFSKAELIFPVVKGAFFELRSLKPNNILVFKVHFPLPYKSAERFPENDRLEFINKYSIFIIANSLSEFSEGARYKFEQSEIIDPRHPDEIKWEKRKRNTIKFINNLIPKRKSKKSRTYREY